MLAKWFSFSELQSLTTIFKLWEKWSCSRYAMALSRWPLTIDCLIALITSLSSSFFFAAMALLSKMVLLRNRLLSSFPLKSLSGSQTWFLWISWSSITYPRNLCSSMEPMVSFLFSGSLVSIKSRNGHYRATVLYLLLIEIPGCSSLGSIYIAKRSPSKKPTIHICLKVAGYFVLRSRSGIHYLFLKLKP